MSLERILSNPVLLAEIAQRLEPTASSILPLERMHEAADSVRSGREANLSDEQEAIIRRYGRPVFVIRKDRVQGDLGDFWRARYEPVRASIEARAIPAVGSLRLDRHPQRRWIGTAWLVAPDVAVTNRHVADVFAQAQHGSFAIGADPFGEQTLAFVDFRREYDRRAKREFRVNRVLHIEPMGAGRPDVALLKLSSNPHAGTEALTENLLLCEQDPTVGTVVAAIGYPARDGERNERDVMQEVFAGIYDVKRFQPGEVTELKNGYFHHDCSTLGGNSGSVIVDFASGRAAGLHYAGLYEKHNFAVRASTLAELLHRLKITTA